MKNLITTTMPSVRDHVRHFTLIAMAMCLLPFTGCSFYSHPSAGPYPTRTRAGSYVAVEQALKSGFITESWREGTLSIERPRIEHYKGTAYWAIPVTYRLAVVFGLDLARTRALVKHDRVHHWLYYGSDEIVP